MNQANPKKLLNSKWTALRPANKEKHFRVTEVERNEGGVIIHCEIEAIMTSRTLQIDWRDLKNSNKWAYGWV